MIALVQRVSSANVSVAGSRISEIHQGMLVLLGIEANDTSDTVRKMSAKLLKFRMFNDEQGKMNLNIQQSCGDILVVSQFTLVADTQKGNRPGFSKGASPALGEELYNTFVAELNNSCTNKVQTGQFGADMQVSLVNDGPVTFSLQI
jgi:D-tyrosyl-tRNA(Tyr) deacylase